jgi:hypothetical protein
MADITSLVDLSLLVDGQTRHAADVTTPLNNLIDIINDMLNGDQAFDEAALTIATVTTLNVSGTIISTRDGATNTPLFLSYGNSAGSYLFGYRARNTQASPQAVQASDVLVALGGVGHNGTSFGSAQGQLEIQANQTFTTTNKGTKMVFKVTPDNSTTVTQALVIHNDNRLEIEGTLDHDGAAVGFFGTAPAAQSTGWTTFTNLSSDKTCNADSSSVAELADILGTLIEYLKTIGLLAA